MEKKAIGQILHANTKATQVSPREIRNSQESIAKDAKRFNADTKTIPKWKKPKNTKGFPMQPKKIFFQKLKKRR